MKKDYLIIDRAKWRTGRSSEQNKTGKGETNLLNEQGYMCCLGFRCHQMGVPKKMLLYRGSPQTIALKYDLDIPDLVDDFCRDTKFTDRAIDINDDEDTCIKDREKLITEHFATIGVTVEFKGKYVKP